MERSVRVERGESGRRFAVAGDVAATPDAAWHVLVDTERWPDWGPSVTDVRCADRRIRTGSTGEVQVAGGPWVGFEITTFDDGRATAEADSQTGPPPVRRWTWSVARIPATGHRVEARPGGCRVVFEVPLWAAGYVPVCRRALAEIGPLLE